MDIIVEIMETCILGDCQGCNYREYPQCRDVVMRDAINVIKGQQAQIMELRKHKHGMSHTRIYKIWTGMRQRCFSPQHKDYPDYGGRGITICDEWSDFKTFYEWATDNGYSDELSIDRINTNGNYCPENCRWADDVVQSRNRRFTQLSYNGETHTIAEWAKILGIGNTTIRTRLKKGMSIEQILSPKRSGGSE